MFKRDISSRKFPVKNEKSCRIALWSVDSAICFSPCEKWFTCKLSNPTKHYSHPCFLVNALTPTRKLRFTGAKEKFCPNLKIPFLCRLTSHHPVSATNPGNKIILFYQTLLSKSNDTFWWLPFLSQQLPSSFYLQLACVVYTRDR